MRRAQSQMSPGVTTISRKIVQPAIFRETNASVRASIHCGTYAIFAPCEVLFDNLSCVELSTYRAGIDARLTATPHFASGVSDRSQSARENTGPRPAQVDRNRKILSTRRKCLQAKGLWLIQARKRRKSLSTWEVPDDVASPGASGSAPIRDISRKPRFASKWKCLTAIQTQNRGVFAERHFHEERRGGNAC